MFPDDIAPGGRCRRSRALGRIRRMGACELVHFAQYLVGQHDTGCRADGTSRSGQGSRASRSIHRSGIGQRTRVSTNTQEESQMKKMTDLQTASRKKRQQSSVATPTDLASAATTDITGALNLILADIFA